MSKALLLNNISRTLGELIAGTNMYGFSGTANPYMRLRNELVELQVNGGPAEVLAIVTSMKTTVDAQIAALP